MFFWYFSSNNSSFFQTSLGNVIKSISITITIINGADIIIATDLMYLLKNDWPYILIIIWKVLRINLTSKIGKRMI
jgi:hypothetical protein